LACWNSADLIYRDINNLVLNYLINEGYPLAAEKFSAEANIPVNLRDGTLQARVGIRNAILEGNVEDAIHKINENFPTVSQRMRSPNSLSLYD